MNKTLIFLHGWGTTSKIWQAQVTHFSSSWLVLTPDYLCGDFLLFPSRLSLENMTDGLFSFCHQRSLAQIHLIGWSLGSMIAMDFTSRFPDLVSSLTIVAGTPKFVAEKSFPCAMPRGELRLLQRRFKNDRLLAFSSFHKLLFTEREKKPALMLKLRDLLKADCTINDQALLDGLNILGCADLRSVLSRLKVPVLILHGDSDQLCPLGAAQYMYKSIPHSHLKIFVDCGHLPFLTREVEFNQVLGDFLASIHR